MTKGRVSSLSSSSLIDQIRYEYEKHDSTGNSAAVFLSRRRIRTTVQEWGRMLLLTAAVLGLYLWRGGESLLLLLSAGGIIISGGLLMQLCGPRRVAVHRIITPKRPSAGDTVTVEVQLSFASKIPLPWMIVADYWSGGSHQELLFPGFRRSFTYSYELKSVPRGIHQLYGCGVTWGDLPGLFTGGCQPEGRESFKVLPKALYLTGSLPDNRAMPGDRMLPARGKQGSAEAADIRDYAPGDPLSRIHWKNSARKGTLQSRVPEREAGQMTCIVLANSPEDYEVPYGALVPRGQRGTVMPAFERAVSAAMGLMLSAERSGSYLQLFSGGWPEGMPRHEGLGQIPGRVQDLLTEISPSGSQSLSRLLEDASRGWIPGMTVSVITGRLEEESARTIARFLVQGIKVELYYVWDQSSPGGGQAADTVRSTAGSRQTKDGFPESAQSYSTDNYSADSGGKQRTGGTISGSLMRLGARIHCLNVVSPAQGYKGAEHYGFPGKPTSN
ncbi:DUF58 domain-containing protein [Paenibacillus borealis]|uniref:DUF58 domain-containing protein n=1 Tax=Paenibacillus borealis TaxID=160799 RepID=UPI0009DDC345|nr:DUF58 domain-containing protein [Paenibacillus borealis]